MKIFPAAWVIASTVIAFSAIKAQDAPSVTTAAAVGGAKLFAAACAGCHGADASGGVGPSLLNPQLSHGAEADKLAVSISHGYPERGMPSFGGTLTTAQIEELTAFITQRRSNGKLAVFTKLMAEVVARSAAQELPKGVVHSDAADFVAEKVAQLGAAYGFAFLPDQSILVTQLDGKLRLIDSKGRISDIAGAPSGPTTNDIFTRHLLDVSLHPDYPRNGWIYLTYPANVPPPNAWDLNVTVCRGRIKNGKWTDQQDLVTFLSNGTSSAHMAWDTQGFLYLATIDDAMHWDGPLEKAAAQDLSSPLGKILRMTDEGKAPKDNPFHTQPGAFPYIWSIGHRASTGIAFDADGELWEDENGPEGGDEINHVRRGRNYGWPVVSWGLRYADDARTLRTYSTMPGMEPPVSNFSPSPGAGGLTFYTGSAFPKWRGNIFFGTLKAGDLYRIVVDGDREVLREVVLHGVGRIRALKTGPDGFVYGLTDSGNLFRLRPAA